MKIPKRKKRNALEISDEKVCQALTKAKGYQSIAADMLDKSAAWMSERCTSSAMIQAHLKWLGERKLDRYEGALDDLMEKKNPTSIIFFLKTRGRGRGYIEHAPIEDVDTGKLKVLGDFFASIGAKYRTLPTTTPEEPKGLDSSREKNADQDSSDSSRRSHFS